MTLKNEYSKIDCELRREIPFKDYCDAQMKLFNKKRRHPHQEKNLKEEINKASLPKFEDQKEPLHTHGYKYWIPISP